VSKWGGKVERGRRAAKGYTTLKRGNVEGAKGGDKKKSSVL